MKTYKPIQIDRAKLKEVKPLRSERFEHGFQAQIKHDLDSALIFGKTFNHNVQLVINTSGGLRAVEAAVWTTTEQNVILEGGATLPIDCIESLKM